MSENNGSSMGGTYTAFAVGALVGAGLALLLAPRSGRETRELICKKSSDLGDAARDAVEKGKQLVTEAGHRVASAVQAGKKAAEDVKAELTADR